MAQLIVRNIEEELVRELKLRAAQSGQSAEETHRQILRDALGLGRRSSSLKQILSSMPDVGEDRDFQRVQDRGRAVSM